MLEKYKRSSETLGAIIVQLNLWKWIIVKTKYMQDEPRNEIGEMVDMLICLTIIIISLCLSKHHVAYIKSI